MIWLFSIYPRSSVLHGLFSICACFHNNNNNYNNDKSNNESINKTPEHEKLRHTSKTLSLSLFSFSRTHTLRLTAMKKNRFVTKTQPIDSIISFFSSAHAQRTEAIQYSIILTDFEYRYVKRKTKSIAQK